MATVDRKRKAERPKKDRKRQAPDNDTSPSKGKPPLPPGNGTRLPRAPKVPTEKKPKHKSMVNLRHSPEREEIRSSLTAPVYSKSCNFYQDDNYQFPPIKIVIHPKKYRKLDIMLRDLSRRMPQLPFGVRSVYTPAGRNRVTTLEDLTDDGNYICSTYKHKARGLDVSKVVSRHAWHHGRPDSGQRRLNLLLRENENMKSASILRGRPRPDYDLSRAYMEKHPKKLHVMRNGDPTDKHIFLLNRRTAQTFEQILDDLSGMFGFAVQKLYTIDGKPITGIKPLIDGPDALVAAPLEDFKPMALTSSQTPGSRLRSRMSDVENLQSRLQNRKDRLAKTKGRWKVWVQTNAMPSASTRAQVTMTVYGNKGNSGPITLGQGDGQHFQAGHIDEFTVSVGNVGEVYKIRIAHDNSGDFPGWLCDELRMRDLDTDEELVFPCKRWLARDEDDQEICRELPAVRRGEAVLPIMKYEIEVHTGDIWGGGTDANVYITIYGDRGDSGVRQLYAENKGIYFRKGQVDHFTLEAVTLGHLRRIIIGHDGTGPGEGWFLEKVIVREPRAKPHEEYVFYCGKWLDEGEDDGKIVRELKVQDEYMDDVLEKRNWEYEKWKFEKGNQLKFYSIVTGKCLRLQADGSVDGLGKEKDNQTVFEVVPKKPTRPMFCSVAHPDSYLVIDNGHISGMGKGGPYGEFRVRVQHDRTVMLESVKNPLQFITINHDGKPGEVRGILDKDPTRRFFVYCKGAFRHRGVIMLCTSAFQAINLEGDGSILSGLGRRAGPAAQFRVHKVGASGSVRMFESIANPGNYIRLMDGKIDCMGDRGPDSQFLVTKHKDKGYITLQMNSHRGLFVGMTPEGKVHPTIDTGVKNIYLFPEIVENGIPKSESTAMLEEELMQEIRGQAKSQTSSPKAVPPEPKKQPQFSAGDWSIHVSSEETLDDADVALVAYGNKGNSGRIILGAPPGKKIFQGGNEDEFRANLLKVGKLFKIRLELVVNGVNKNPKWKVKDVTLQDLNSKEILKFNFGRWLSRNHEDLEIMRELPVNRPGEEHLRVLKYVVSVYTGKESGAETDASVYITLYGERGDSGKRQLIKSNNARKFRTGQKDVFHLEVVDLAKLQTCVIGHDSTAAGEGWYLEKVTVKESDNATEEYVFPCHKWLDTSMEDRKIERVLTVKEVLPVELNISSKEESDEKHVAITEDVDEEKQLAITEVVDEEKKVAITEEVAEGDETSKREGSIPPKPEILLQGSPTEETGILKDVQTPKKSGVEYDVFIKTSEDSKPANGGKVTLTVYGNNGKSDDIKLFATNANSAFEPGNMDEFEIFVGDIGDIYKIRVMKEDSDKWEGWHLIEVKLKDKDTDEEIIFPFNRWLARDKDDGDIARELPVLLPSGQHATPVCHYLVQVYTGDHWGAGTDANMYITLHGMHGDSGRRLLYRSATNTVKFQRGQVDSFEFEVVSLDKLTAIDISHDGKGHGAGIFLDKVIIKEKKGSDLSPLQYIFPCGRWLDDHEDDCKTERTLRMIDVIDSKNLLSSKGAGKKSQGHWTVQVKTSDLKDAGTTAQVYVTIYGTNGHSSRLQLGKDGNSTDLFSAGKESTFQVDIGDIGKVTKLRLEHSNSGPKPDWHVDYVKLTDDDTQDMLVFYVDRWLALDKEDGQICRELPVVKIGSSSLPVLHYVVAVMTGHMENARMDQGSVYISLHGIHGDTGFRELKTPISKNRLPLQPGQEDIFILEAVSVGRLKKIEVKIDGNGVSKWYVQQVRVMEGKRAWAETIFYCHKWLGTDKNLPLEFSVSDMCPSNDLIDALESIPKGLTKPVSTKGRWLIWVQTGLQADAGTSEKIFLVLSGLKGQSDPILINGKDSLNPGSVVKLEAKVDEIGMVFKVQFYFDEKHVGTSWFLQKLKLKDQDTGEELHFDYKDWMESTEDNPGGFLELPAARPDILPMKEQVYIVSVETGNLDCADTEADVFCDLIGQWGSSSQRSLAVSNNKKMFRIGQVDDFCITCVDLGSIQKVLIGHNTTGRGRGWYCEVVKVKLAEQWEKIFPCRRWLDTGCDDRQLVTQLSPLSELLMGVSTGQKYLSNKDGLWNYHITSAGPEKLPKAALNRKLRTVSIVVYGLDGTVGPIELENTDSDTIMPGKTDHFFVILEEQKSKDILKFDFSRWVGEVGGDIRKEVPVVIHGKPYDPILQYFVMVHTSEAEVKAGTNSNVFITIYGSKSDSGRRHLIRSLKGTKKFDTGQVDIFIVEAVDLGRLEKIVVAKGPGMPWLLEKIIVKKSQYEATEHIFLHEKWIGTKDNQKEEIEMTLKLTATLESNVAVSVDHILSLKSSDGSWKIETVTGGTKESSNNLDPVVIFCGNKRESKPLPLRSSSENPFQIGHKDTFLISFEDSDTGDVFMSELNNWVLVDNKLDGWKEFPIMWPAVQIPAVMIYIVSIHIGDVHKAGTDSNVYIELYGDRGMTGRRFLKHSISNTEKFKQNQVDVFELEAVYLGDVEKVVIGHDSKGPGNGWYLEKVVVQQSPDSREVIFACNKWLDEKEDDHQIERTLHTGFAVSRLGDDFEVAPPLVKASASKQEEFEEEEDKEDTMVPLPKSPEDDEHLWRVMTTTGNDPGQKTGNSIELVLYGTKGQSEPIIIGDQEGFKFNSGQIDTFDVKVKADVGDVYKVRVGFHGSEQEVSWYQDYSSAPSWCLEKLTMMNVTKGNEYEFEGQVWIKLNNYNDFWRELPVKNGAQKLKAMTYQVETYTGQKFKAGTDASVFIQLFGEWGDTGRRRLMESKTNSNKFENGSRDLFELQAVDLGKLVKVKVSHSGVGPGSGWSLDKVIIKESPTAVTKYVFKYERWLDEGDGDGGIDQELVLTDIIEGEDPEEIDKVHDTPWQVHTVTGSEAGMGSSCPIELILYGLHGHSQPVVIGEKENFHFKEGQTNSFDVRVVEDIGDLYKVRVGFHDKEQEALWYQNYSQAPTWYLEKMSLENMTTKNKYDFEAKTWLKVDDNRDFWRELPVKGGKEELKILRYLVEVHTGEKFKAGTDANVYLQVFGQRGDTGERRLMTSKTNPLNKFEAGKMDLFEIEAVDLGVLNKVKVSHDGAGEGAGWFLHRISIRELNAKDKYVFNWDRWLDIKDGRSTVEAELPLTEVVEEKEPEPKPQTPHVEWKVLVTTSSEPDSSTDAKVMLTIYGDYGNSGPILLQSPDASPIFERGKTDEFNVSIDLEELGPIQKIRLEHNNSGLLPGWRVEKVVLINKAENINLTFPVNRLLSSDKFGDTVVEIPNNTRPHILPVRKYVVQTVTGAGSGAGTDAVVYIKLVGTIADSGKRNLLHNLEDTNKFETGKTDTFIIEAVDLGRLQEVVIGHDGSGPGSGWLLDKIVVKESQDAKEKYIFTCGEWLSDQRDSRLTEKTLSLDKVINEDEDNNVNSENMENDNDHDGNRNEEDNDEKGKKTEDIQNQVD
ncbi:hypothetical protein ACJMK2_042519 [Sinanodonta woodiana]|uniref:Lipoxygenase homology domain-containing protein 1 n=1 Tax=Sinanodonta woodiana TaxID=1069815 RepID=A0ABD3W7N4_SINWO